MDNPEKLATWDTQDEQEQNKNTTQCAGHHYAPKMIRYDEIDCLIN